MQSARKMLRDDQWKKIEALLPGNVGDPGRSGQNNRQFVEAVLPVYPGVIYRRNQGIGIRPIRVLSAGVKPVYGKK